MVDAYSPNFSLDGLGLDLSSVGRCDLGPRSGARATKRALPFPLSRKSVRLEFSSRRSTRESRPPLAPRARRAPPLTRADPRSLETQVTSHRRSRLADPQRSLEVRRAAPSPPGALETGRWRKNRAVTWGPREPSVGELFSTLLRQIDRDPRLVWVIERGFSRRVLSTLQFETRGGSPRARARARLHPRPTGRHARSTFFSALSID